MFKVSLLITFAAGAAPGARRAFEADLDTAVAGLPNLKHTRIHPALEGSVNGGDLVCHLQFLDEADYRACRAGQGWDRVETLCSSGDVCRFDWAAYRQGELGIRDPAIANGVHRILLLAVRPSVPAEKISRFEAEMPTMPAYVTAIRNWGFSRVVDCGGARLWTHVWEQEFADPQALFGPYMMHPIHFAYIDRWFDTQSHDWIVDPELCSTYCALETSVLALPPSISHR